PGGRLSDVSATAKLIADDPSDGSPAAHVLLHALATLVVDGHVAAAPDLRRAANLFLTDLVSPIDWLRWGTVAPCASIAAWDPAGWLELSTRNVEHARASGALEALAVAVNGLGVITSLCGALDSADALVAEETAIKELTGIVASSAGAPLLWA